MTSSPLGLHKRTGHCVNDVLRLALSPHISQLKERQTHRHGSIGAGCDPVRGQWPDPDAGGHLLLKHPPLVGPKKATLTSLQVTWCFGPLRVCCGPVCRSWLVGFWSCTPWQHRRSNHDVSRLVTVRIGRLCKMNTHKNKIMVNLILSPFSNALS